MAGAGGRRRLRENRLLAALPAAEYDQLRPHLEPVTLSWKQVLAEPDEPLSHVYFPERGLISLLTLLADGSAIEVATIGYEGMLGLAVVLDAESSPGKALVQMAGEALRVPAATFKDCLQTSPTLQRTLHRYTHALFYQVAQSVACNSRHAIEQRCARWLLLSHDQVLGDEFPLTQEFLAEMLGVRRSGVTLVARRLQAAGLIRYRRGQMTILDRPGLETVACECYRVVRVEFDRLLD